MNSRTGHFEPIAREGLSFVGISAILALTAWWSNHPWLSLFFLVLAAAIASFFRNPARRPPDDDAKVVSPADGVVMEIMNNAEGPVLGKTGLTRVSIFMSIFNVHVNRWPFSGVVRKISHRPGKFLDARDPSSSILNENNSLVVDTAFGPIEVVQIAGKIARRIVWWVREGDVAEKGDRFGLIRFGSRVDVYLPDHFIACASVGSKVKAGVTVIARLAAQSDSHTGN
ncbi:MAG: phosphatidylserine decarboxylase family protein [Deltaproteobacteria bacterium]|nr:phosphatidylserine decarboxylase family protein [Deltaproteobacteria bacterium]